MIVLRADDDRALASLEKSIHERLLKLERRQDDPIDIDEELSAVRAACSTLEDPRERARYLEEKVSELLRSKEESSRRICELDRQRQEQQSRLGDLLSSQESHKVVGDGIFDQSVVRRLEKAVSLVDGEEPCGAGESADAICTSLEARISRLEKCPSVECSDGHIDSCAHLGELSSKASDMSVSEKFELYESEIKSLIESNNKQHSMSATH